jgi:Resolvase, N terminal domain
MTEKIQPTHLARTAYVYVRQSTAQQVRHHQEGQLRQYALADHAHCLGFHRTHCIDDDLGRSGSGRQERPGFARLLAAVCEGVAGAVFALEASRLARNNRDWHHLVDLCALTETLLVDYDGVYDPRQLNDRLLLGLNRPDSYSTSYSTFRLDVELRCAVPMPSRRQRYPTCLEVKRRPKAVRHPAALSRSAIWAYVCRFAS